MKSIKEILMERDGLSEQDAINAVEDARELLAEYAENDDTVSAMNICMDEFGLEEDYLMELLS